jgi:hypothetical protein
MQSMDQIHLGHSFSLPRRKLYSCYVLVLLVESHLLMVLSFPSSVQNLLGDSAELSIHPPLSLLFSQASARPDPLKCNDISTSLCTNRQICLCDWIPVEFTANNCNSQLDCLLLLTREVCISIYFAMEEEN